MVSYEKMFSFLYRYIGKTRAGVCKTLCPKLPDSNTAWLQHCLPMMVTTIQIWDFNVILSKGNNSKIGDNWDKKTRGPWWSYIAHLTKQICIFTVEVSAKFTALGFLYKLYSTNHPHPPPPSTTPLAMFFYKSWRPELNLKRGSPKDWLCWGLTTRQPLWVILCRLPEKGRRVIEEIVEEMKERNREERGTGTKVKKQKK